MSEYLPSLLYSLPYSVQLESYSHSEVAVLAHVALLTSVEGLPHKNGSMPRLLSFSRAPAEAAERRGRSGGEARGMPLILPSTMPKSRFRTTMMWLLGTKDPQTAATHKHPPGLAAGTGLLGPKVRHLFCEAQEGYREPQGTADPEGSEVTAPAMHICLWCS